MSVRIKQEEEEDGRGKSERRQGGGTLWRGRRRQRSFGEMCFAFRSLGVGCRELVMALVCAGRKKDEQTDDPMCFLCLTHAFSGDFECVT